MKLNKINRFLTFSFLFIICASLFACRGMFFNAESAYEKGLKQVPYDAVIIPGIPFKDTTWNFIMKGRVLWSVYLYNQGYVKNIIYSGSAVYSPYIEAQIMAMYAEKLGVPREHIFTETRAEHSTENIFYSCMVAKQNGFKKLALATDRFQSRSLAEFLPTIRRKTGFDVKSLPIQYNLMKSMPDEDDPKISYELARVDSFVSITDRESAWKRFWGTMGKNINYNEQDVISTQPAAEKMPATN